MKTLWRTRLRQHQKAQAKYLRLVFNDHFVLVLVILLGALLYGYAQLIQTLTSAWWLAPVLAVILTVLLRLGGLATLLVPADATFLLPQTAAMLPYLLKARRYSLLLPMVGLVLWTFAALPLMGVMHLGPVSAGVPLAVSLLAFKDTDMWLQLLARYGFKQPRWRQDLLSLVAGGSLMAGFWLHPAVTLVVALCCDLSLRWRLGDWLYPERLAWLATIAQEQRRLMRLYRFYNLFTDVPGLTSTVKRRRYLDGITKLLPQGQPHTWGFLFLRGFLRRTEFLGLYLRLTALGAIILTAVGQWWLTGILAALFVYLVGFQLLPFYLVYDANVFTHLYPLPPGQKPAAFQHLVGVFLGIEAILLALGALVGGHLLGALAALGGGAGMALGFAGWYLPLRFKQLASKS